jgi:hypothetical protein
VKLLVALQHSLAGELTIINSRRPVWEALKLGQVAVHPLATDKGR